MMQLLKVTWTVLKALKDADTVHTLYYTPSSSGTNSYDVFATDDTNWLMANVTGTTGGSSGQVFNDTYKPNAISVTSFEDAVTRSVHVRNELRLNWTYFKAVKSRSGALIYYTIINATTNTYNLYLIDGDRVYVCYVTGTGGGDSGTEFETTYQGAAVFVPNLAHAIAAEPPPEDGVTPFAGYKLSLVGGLDSGGVARTLQTDAFGNVEVRGTIKITDSAGSTLLSSTNSLLTTVRDGSGAYAVVLDAAAQPASRAVVMVGGTDGANIRMLKTDTAGNLGVVQRAYPVIDTTGDIVLYGTLTTSATTANQVVVTHTVTAGKTFYLCGFSLNKVASAAGAISAAGGRMALQANGADIDQSAAPASATAVIDWVRQYSVAFPIATAGQVVRLVVTPSANTSTVWAGRLIGIEL